MPWFKVDDKLHDHRKARAAGANAMGVWLLCGSWVAGNLTDGFVPRAIVMRFGRQRDANKLVEVGLWTAAEQDGEAGWLFHDWHEFQPTRAQKLEERAAKAEAGRIGGLQSGRSRREAKTKQSASGLLEPPSRPVPTRPTTGTNVPVSAAPPHERDGSRFEDFWDVYAHKVGRKKAETAYRAALKKPGVTEELLITSAAAYIAWQTSEGKHPQYTKHASTWLTGEHWRDERPESQAPMTNTQRHMALVQQLAAEERGETPRQIGEGR